MADAPSDEAAGDGAAERACPHQQALCGRHSLGLQRRHQAPAHQPQIEVHRALGESHRIHLRGEVHQARPQLAVAILLPADDGGGIVDACRNVAKRGGRGGHCDANQERGRRRGCVWPHLGGGGGASVGASGRWLAEGDDADAVHALGDDGRQGDEVAHRPARVARQWARVAKREEHFRAVVALRGLLPPRREGGQRADLEADSCVARPAHVDELIFVAWKHLSAANNSNAEKGRRRRRISSS